VSRQWWASRRLSLIATTVHPFFVDRVPHQRPVVPPSHIRQSGQSSASSTLTGCAPGMAFLYATVFWRCGRILRFDCSAQVSLILFCHRCLTDQRAVIRVPTDGRIPPADQSELLLLGQPPFHGISCSTGGIL